MYITKKIKTIGISSLAALTIMGSVSMVAFASSTSSKVEPSTTGRAAATATTVKPNQVSISKSGTGIKVETTTVNLDNVKLNKAEPASKVEATIDKDHVGKAELSTVTVVKPNQIAISKSGTGIKIETTTDKLDNVKGNKTEPATTVTNKVK